MLANAGDCPICCERMEKGKAVFVTECGHAFHFACLQGYDSTGELPCPICRAHLSEPPILLKNRRVEGTLGAEPTRTLKCAGLAAYWAGLSCHFAVSDVTVRRALMGRHPERKVSLLEGPSLLDTLPLHTVLLHIYAAAGSLRILKCAAVAAYGAGFSCDFAVLL